MQLEQLDLPGGGLLTVYLRDCVETMPQAMERPLVLVVPGGGYSHVSAREGDPVALQFAAAGYHTAVLRYAVGDDAAHGLPLRQLAAAIGLVRQHAAAWHVQPDKIAVCGFSAGGHLCASTGTLYREIDADAGDEVDNFPCRPDAIIPCYPVINLTDGIAHRGSGENLLGDKINTPEAAKLDLDKRVSPDDPPAFLWHTADDGAVNVENSIRFAQAMWKAGVTCALHVFPHAPHGVGLGLDYPDIAVWPELAAKFLTVNCKFIAGK